MKENCSVTLDVNCKSPAGWFQGTRGVCFACGLAVCTRCSSRRKYFRYGVKRVCFSCQEQHGMKLGPKFKEKKR